MSGARILSDEQIERMAEMRERGLTCGDIAAYFTRNGTPVSDRTIRWQCLRVGAYKPGGPHKLTGRHAWGKGRPFTRQEDAKLLAMRKGGKRIYEISKELGRPHNSIIGRLLTLAMYDAQQDAAA